ncbi:MAG: flippase-like domain-containing protein [Pirellulales bacterium]|nr:flippase-like domain-containing protein [Pirellulales bacterium]
MTSQTLPSRRILVWVLRIAALLLVGWGVSGSVRGALEKLSRQDWHVQPGWLVLSGTLYAFGLVPMGWFWQRTLVALGSPTPLPAALRAYFLGHLGKYVPGKAMSVILRVATVRRWVPSMRIALVSALVETLTMMAVGALLAAVISAFVLRLDHIITFVALGMACAAVAPTLPPIARLLASIGIARGKSPEDAESPPSVTELAANFQRINFQLLATGWAAAAVCWSCAGLSLWATMCALGIDAVGPLHDFPLLVAAAAFSVVAGFMSQLPAGLGVRDALLMQLLVPVCGEANALVVAVLLRLVWLVSEVVICGILYIGGVARHSRSN